MYFLQTVAATLTLTGAAFLATGAAAQSTMDHSKMDHTPASSPAVKAAVAAWTDGEVKKIDLKAQTITLRHGLIKNLDMPAMTMVFKVKTPALLERVKAGDKVKFSAEMPNGVLTVTALELAR
jgi:Cu/Ag efflux protein CusF